MKGVFKEGYAKVKRKVIKFGKDISDTVAALVTVGSQIAIQYYNEVMIFRNRTNPLQLFCEKSRNVGFCKCLLKRLKN